jgi:Txe/YoeB family toxin of Txe-Axe toxin-antitoxin module
MNSDFYSKTNQNIIDKLDQLITTVNRQTMTIENQTEVIDQLRTELDSKSLENKSDTG